MLTPLDIQNKEFKKGMRGYKEDQVDEFLDELMVDYEKLYKENSELKDETEKAHTQLEQYKNIEETLKNTLVVAQSTAEQVRQSGQKSAQIMIQEAENKGKELLYQANKQVDVVSKEYEDMKRQVQIFKNRYKALLQSQLDIVVDLCEELEDKE
ncbi:DivIVA family protein [Alkaliphilus metalliredigens QYMF]|uniref:DivIVA family protein n=1 Tax=Alkaliphilus metalliredigens (strain QYMF) TaxID=293826 RepID=A6TRY2_ALKMQ|nr:DivIVA domain-containing protein [Alkaliphilus metalliredigens]ABR48950.1 DivIVA family protein [Alkaliphilus metalliredigens QYMF]